MHLACQAILFDFDGVLIDSEPVYERHWKEWADERGASYEHIISIHQGIPAIRTIGIVAPHLDAVHEVEQFQLRCINDLEGLVGHNGVKVLLESLPADRWAIATSSYRNIVSSQLKYLDLPTPRVLVTVEDVEHGKPAPDPYLQAAEKLGFPISECIVIEDSLAGIDAGKKAGARVIAVATTKLATELQQADVIVSHFADLDIKPGKSAIEISLK